MSNRGQIYPSAIPFSVLVPSGHTAEFCSKIKNDETGV